MAGQKWLRDGHDITVERLRQIVHYDPLTDKRCQKYRAHIEHRGKQYHLGTFATIDEALAARLDAERALFTHARERG